MRNPNGYGGISKLPGNRRNPFRVRVTTGWDLTPDGKQKQLLQTLGYYPTRKEAMMALAEYNQNPYDLNNKKITFETCYNYMAIRNNATAANHTNCPWSLTATNNIFIGAPDNYYYNCRFTSSDTIATTPANAVFTDNVYKHVEGNEITPDSSKFVGVKSNDVFE